MADMTKAQARFIERHKEDPSRRYNGRALAMIERLAKAGHIEYASELVPSVKRWSWRITVRLKGDTQ